MNRHAHCLFCDDIRYEVGNKTSLVGIYGGTLQVESVPALLPKLCVATFLSTPVGSPVSSLSIRVQLDGELLHQVDLPPEQLASGQQLAATQGTEEDPVQIVSLGAHMVLSPFAFQKEGSVTVTIIADGDELLAGKLRLRIDRPLH